MAHTPYTGKMVADNAKWNALAIPGWRLITIEETAGPLPEQLDKTTAADSAYSTLEDPLGAKGSAKTAITIEGLASKTDVADTGLFSHAMDDAHAFVYQKGAGVDKFSVTPVLKRRTRPAAIATLVPYTLVLEKEDVGAWTAS